MDGTQKEEAKFLASLRAKSRIFDPTKSPLRKYQEYVIGDGNLITLLKYELIITSLSWIPGVSGIFLRKYFYKYLFKEKLVNVIFGKNIDIFNPHGISIGKNCLIGDNCLLEAKTDGKIFIGNNVQISRGTLIRCAAGSIEIGDNTGIASYSHIAAMGTKVKLGENVLIAAYSYVIGGAGYGLGKVDIPLCTQPRLGKGIIIEDDVWLGAGVYVIDGNKIGTGSVIGAGSVVTKDIPEYSIAVGVPAKVIKKRR